jgi:hypothetical protein
MEQRRGHIVGVVDRHENALSWAIAFRHVMNENDNQVALLFKNLFDFSLQQACNCEGKWQAGVVTFILDGVDGLARHTKPDAEFTL